jgi:hypothetical protein
MPVKRKWLKALVMFMMVGASFGGPMNPREIEDLMHVMNETRIEFTIPDENDKGDGIKTLRFFRTQSSLRVVQQNKEKADSSLRSE